MTPIEHLEKVCGDEMTSQNFDKPFLDPAGHHTWATNGMYLARVKQPLTDHTIVFASTEFIAGSFSAAENLTAYSAHRFDSTRISLLKADNLCENCHGDYKKEVVCLRCNGSGQSACSECESEIECPACEGAGKTTCETCRCGWKTTAPTIRLAVSEVKIHFSGWLLELAVNALGPIQIRLTDANVQSPEDAAAYFVWEHGDGLIMPCRV